MSEVDKTEIVDAVNGQPIKRVKPENPSEMMLRVAVAIGEGCNWALPGFLLDRAAKAAIEAMREPTDEQRNAYYELSHRTETMVDAHWERAIDAALK